MKPRCFHEGLGVLLAVGLASAHCGPSSSGGADGGADVQLTPADGALDAAADASDAPTVDAVRVDIGADARDSAPADAPDAAVTDAAVTDAAVTDAGTDVAMDRPADTGTDAVVDRPGGDVVSADSGAADAGAVALSFAAPVTIDLERGSERVVAADFDGDGRLDLAVSNDVRALAGTTARSGISLFHNRATAGTLSASSFAPRVHIESLDIGASSNLHAVDMDRDGRVDIVATGNYLQICRNVSAMGSLTPTSFSCMSFSRSVGSVAIADLDGDGDLDLAALGNGAFEVNPNTSTPGALALAPRLDVARPTSFRYTHAIAAANLDGDALPDVVVSASESQTGIGSLLFYRNTSTPAGISFEYRGTRALGEMDMAANVLSLVDLNGDERNDLYLHQLQRSSRASPDCIWLSTNSGDPMFGPATFASESAIGLGSRLQLAQHALGRLDRGATTDIVGVDMSSVRVWVNQAGRGDALTSSNVRYVESLSARIGPIARSVVIADLDGDGLNDIVAVKRENGSSDLNNRLALLRNTTP